MRLTPTAIAEVLVIEPAVFGDERGFFMETFNEARYTGAGVHGPFVQDNVSLSRKGVLRGLHFQQPCAQGKLVSVLRGAVWDVAVDVRSGSPTFGRWVAAELSEANHRQLWVPPGFAHGFVVLSDAALFAYKCTQPYRPEHERVLKWNDPSVGIEWPVASPTVSARDETGTLLREFSPSSLPRYVP